MSVGVGDAGDSPFRRGYLSGVKEALFRVRPVDEQDVPSAKVTSFLRRSFTSFFAMELDSPVVVRHYTANETVALPVTEARAKIVMLVPLSGVESSHLLVVMNTGDIFVLGPQSLKKLQTHKIVQRCGVLWVSAGKNSHLFYQTQVSGVHVHEIEPNGDDKKMCTWASPVGENEFITGIAVVSVGNRKMVVLAGGGSLFTTSYDSPLSETPHFRDITSLVLTDTEQHNPALLLSNAGYLVYVSFVIYVIPLGDEFPKPSLCLSLKKIETVLAIAKPGLSFTDRKMQPFLTETHLIMFSERHYAAISLETGKVAFLHTFHQPDVAKCISPPACPGANFFIYVRANTENPTAKVLEVVTQRPGAVHLIGPVLPLKNMNEMFIERVRKGDIVTAVSSDLCNVSYIILRLIQDGDYASAIDFLVSDPRMVIRPDPVLISELQAMAVSKRGQQSVPDSQLGLLDELISALNVRALAMTPTDKFEIFTNAAKRCEDTRRNGIAYITQLIRMGKFAEAVSFISKKLDYEYILPSIAVKNPHEYVAAVMRLSRDQAKLLRCVLPFVKGCIGTDMLLSLLKTETKPQAALDWLWAFCFEPNAQKDEEKVCELLKANFSSGASAFEACDEHMWFLTEALWDKGLSKIIAFLTTKAPRKEEKPCAQGTAEAKDIVQDISDVLDSIKDLTQDAKTTVNTWLTHEKQSERGAPAEQKVIVGKRSWYCDSCHKHLLGGQICVQMFCGHRFHESCLRREFDQLATPEERGSSTKPEDCPLCGLISTRRLMAPTPPLNIFD